MQKSKHLIVACIPAFNEEKTIERVILLAQRYVDKVIVCDDGSTDWTASIAKGWGVGNPGVKVVVVEEPVRMGKAHALNTALKCAHMSFLPIRGMVMPCGRSGGKPSKSTRGCVLNSKVVRFKLVCGCFGAPGEKA